MSETKTRLDKHGLAYLWQHILAKLSGLDARLSALEARVSALDGQTTNNTNPDTSGD